MLLTCRHEMLCSFQPVVESITDHPLEISSSLNCMCMCELSHIQLFATVACQDPLSMGFPSKDTGAGCHFLLQEIFPTQGSNTSPTSPELTDEFLYHWATWKALNYIQKVTEINLICKFCVFPPKKDLIYKFSMLKKKKNFQVSKNLCIWIKTLILCVCCDIFDGGKLIQSLENIENT